MIFTGQKIVKTYSSALSRMSALPSLKRRLGVGQGLLMGFCFASNRALKKVSFAKSTFNVPRRPVSICEEKKGLSDLSQTQDEWRMSNHRQLFSSCNQPNARESIISGVEFPIPGFYDTE